MTKIALLGAGGKMGVRLAGNLQGSRFEIAPVEPIDRGRRFPLSFRFRQRFCRGAAAAAERTIRPIFAALAMRYPRAISAS